MFVLLIALWTISIILLIADYKTESTRWLAAISFLPGFGGLTVIMKSDVIPFFKTSITHDMNIIRKLELLNALISSLSHYLAPYALLIYGIVYSNIFKESWSRRRKAVVYGLLIPPALMYVFYPVHGLQHHTRYSLLGLLLMC